MIRALIVTLCFASPLVAQEADLPSMTPEACLKGWQSFNFAINSPGRLRAVQPDVTQNGMCRIDKTNADLRVNDFASVDWRATGVEDAVKNRGFPDSFRANFQGIDLIEGLKLPLPDRYRGALGSLAISGSRASGLGGFEIEQMAFDAGDLGAVSFEMDGRGINLSSLEAMQLSLGGMRMAHAKLTIDGSSALYTALIDELDRDKTLPLWPQMLSLLPLANFNGNSRSELVRFAQALPDTGGTFEIEVTSNTGVGILQIVGATMTLENSDKTPADIAAALSQMLTGVRIDASWMPGR